MNVFLSGDQYKINDPQKQWPKSVLIIITIKITIKRILNNINFQFRYSFFVLKICQEFSSSPPFPPFFLLPFLPSSSFSFYFLKKLRTVLFSHVQLFMTPGTATCQALLPHHLPEFATVDVHCISDTIQPSHSPLPFSPPAVNLSHHQGLFQ